MSMDSASATIPAKETVAGLKKIAAAADAGSRQTARRWIEHAGLPAWQEGRIWISNMVVINEWSRERARAARGA